jgi:hypothetical protein
MKLFPTILLLIGMLESQKLKLNRGSKLSQVRMQIGHK